MANYKYVGCVTAFSEADTTQLIQPTDPLYPVARPINDYTERLVGVSLLIGNEDGATGGSGGGAGSDNNQPLVCTASAPVPVNLDMPAGTTNVYAKYRVNGGAWQTYTSAVDIRDSLSEYFMDMQHPEPVTQNLFAQSIQDYVDTDNEYLFGIGEIGFAWGGLDDNMMLPLPFCFVNFRDVDTLFSAASTSDATAQYRDGDPERKLEVLDTTATTIEFATSSGTGLDLVAHVFGGDITLSACSYGNWGGV